MSQPIVPQKTYLLVFLCLIGLTILTTGVAFIDLGPFNTVAALAIAFCEDAARGLILHGREAQQRARADRLGRRIFLARPSDRLHDERLSHPFLDPRAGFVVHHRTSNSPITFVFSVILCVLCVIDFSGSCRGGCKNFHHRGHRELRET